MKKKNIRFGDGWCFALVNGSLAEIYFSKRHGVTAFCFVKLATYRSAVERRMIKQDTARCNLLWRKEKFYDTKLKRFVGPFRVREFKARLRLDRARAVTIPSSV